MKTKKEPNARKAEVEALSDLRAEPNEEALNLVVGGVKPSSRTTEPKSEVVTAGIGTSPDYEGFSSLH